MGRVAKLLSFARTVIGSANVDTATVDRGGKDNRTLPHFSAPGDDAFPLPGDYVQGVAQTGTGRDSAVGYIDPKKVQKTQAGDKRIYSRRADTGELIAEMWLKNDGTVIITNSNGIFTLEAGGNVVINGATIDTAGNITSPSSISAPSIIVAGKELAGHTHPAGSPPGDTGGNN